MSASARSKIIEMHEEITKLREQVAEQESVIKTLEIEFGDVRDSFLYYKEMTRAQAAVIEKFKRAIGDWDRAETPSELQSAESGLLKALSIPTDSTQILEQYVKEKTQAQAAVIEKLRDAFVHIQEYWNGDANEGAMFDVLTHIENVAHEALAIPTDSTQILDDVRRAEREKCADVCEKSDRYRGDYFASKIRAME